MTLAMIFDQLQCKVPFFVEMLGWLYDDDGVIY